MGPNRNRLRLGDVCFSSGGQPHGWRPTAGGWAGRRGRAARGLPNSMFDGMTFLECLD